MKTFLLVGLSAAFGLAFSVLPVNGQDVVPDYNLSQFELRERVAGAEVDLSKQGGKVVTIEYWGTT